MLKSDAEKFISSTLRAVQDRDASINLESPEMKDANSSPDESHVASVDSKDENSVIKQSFGWLEENEFLVILENSVLQPTKLGEATIAAGMAPHVALHLFDDLSAAKMSLNLETDLHLIYLCTPFQGQDFNLILLFQVCRRNYYCREISCSRG